MGRVALTSIALLLAQTFPGVAEQIRPEMIVRFTEGGVACLDRDHLVEMTLHAIRGEATKAEAMMIGNGGDCVMIPPNFKFKVLSAQYNDPDFDLGILEIGAVGKVSENGVWAYSLGAEEVKSTLQSSRRR